MRSTTSAPPSPALERKRRLERERYANDPEYRERRREQKREYKRTRYAKDPGFREGQLLVIRDRNRERLATDTEYRERKRAYNREYRRRKKAERIALVRGVSAGVLPRRIWPRLWIRLAA